jgi:hypothetical protein
MNFDYSDDQRFLQAEARKFLDARCPPAVTRRVLNDSAMSYDTDLWKAIVEMGWAGTAIPEAYGGSGLGRVDLCAIAEELGRVVAPIPFASTVYVFAEAVLKYGNESQKAMLLRGVASGAVIGCLATVEGPGPLLADAVKTKVAGGRLYGLKTPVIDGDIATHAIILAQAEAGLGLYVVDLADPAMSRQRLDTLDPTRSIAKLTFEGATCAALGTEGEGDVLLSSILDRAAVLMAFEQVGGAGRCLEMARDYALQRYAFGRPIASYQAIKHKLADMYVKNELARSSAYYGAWALDTDARELPQAAAAARLAASGAYDFAAKENLQTHGGIGFTWEMDCHLHLRRSRQLGLALGGAPVWRERLVRRLERRNAA